MGFTALRCFARTVVGGLVTASLLCPSTLHAEAPPRVRVSDERLRVHLKEAAGRSPTLSALLAELNASSVLVFVDCNWFLPAALSGQVSLVSVISGVRYVRVDLRCLTPQTQLMAVLAHELQHALEIGLSEEIISSDSMESYYEDVGFASSRDGTHRRFETEAALTIQRQVAKELKGRLPNLIP
jgi:hypothetical protein